LILGLGNPLRGDDGIGRRVVESLWQRGLPEGVEALAGGTLGLDLLNLLEGPQCAILVDAADMGLEPGQFARFTPDEAQLIGAADRVSLHQVGLAEVLTLARALGRPLPQIVVFGVQPQSMEWGEGLNIEVEAALPLLVEAVLREAVSAANDAVNGERTMPAKILIVEDNPDMALALRMPLEAHGYQVFHASSGQEGLEKVKEAEPDLIILDVMMETATAGFQVSLQLRSSDPESEYAAYSHIPILILTAIHTTTSLRFGPDEAYLPVDDFVEKPIDPDVLLKKVRALVKNKRE